MPLILAIVSLGVLIFVHELGHFLTAKMFGVFVERFSLGFGPKVVGFQKGETEYIISAVPLGGYVKMYGEEPTEEIDPQLKERSFSHKPLWQKSIIVLAGPLANILFAWLLVYSVNVAGFPTLKAEIGKVLPNTPAERAGLKPKDLIVAINGKEVSSWDDMARIIHSHPNQPLTLTVKRNGKTLTIKITPTAKKMKTVFGQEKTVGLIGVYPSGATFTKRYNLFVAAIAATQQTYNMVAVTITGIVKLIQRKVSVKSLGGPIMIVQMATQQAKSGLLQFILFTALISVNLGIINLLPIPILDGGHIVLFCIEGIRRRPLSARTKEIAQKVGLAIIVLIMLLAMYNDITRIIGQKFQ